MKSVLLGLGLLFSWAIGAAVEVGQSAPGFELIDQNGKQVKLSDYQDQIVVLEWYNQDCPFVRKFYDAKEMQRLQASYGEKGVVWLKMISSAPGKQGFLAADQVGAQLSKEGSKVKALLRDVEGTVGQSYGAKTTPHMYVINKGTLVYQGAIDSIRSADPNDIPKAENYVAKALDAVMAGESVQVAKTQPYGCSVKY